MVGQGWKVEQQLLYFSRVFVETGCFDVSAHEHASSCAVFS